MRQYFTLFLVFGTLNLFGQDKVVAKLRNEANRVIRKDWDTSTWNWKRGGIANFNLSQSSLNNWASGGDNFALSVNGYLNYYVFYKKNKFSWDNNIDINLGFIQSTSLGSRKNDDRFDYLSKLDYKLDTTGKWYLSTLFNFRSQFFDGFSYINNISELSSSFLSPAYALLSIGFDLKPSPQFSIYMSPLTARSTIVMSKTILDKGNYGIPDGANVYNEIGAFATVNYSHPINKNINYKGRLDLFSNYKNHPGNIDVFFTNYFTFHINKHLSATYSLDLIYDDDIQLFGPNQTSPALQTKSLIGIGFSTPLNVIRR